MSPAERKRTGRWVAVFVASLIGHGIVLSALRVSPHATGREEMNAIDISFSVVAPRQPTPPAIPMEPLIKEPPSRTNTEPAKRRPSNATARRDPLESVAVPVPDEPESPSPTPAPSDSAPNFDPAVVARAFFVSQQTAPGEGAEAGHAAGHSDAKSPNYFEGVGDKAYLTRREPPKLQRHQDGTYRYRGHAFKAIVAKDGSVEFDDGYRQGSKVVFDMTDMLRRRRGEDPYREEKRWFMESTEELRQGLLELWRAKLERHALLKLRGRLNRLSEDRTLTDRQKAARVVAMFEDTADDDSGTAARGVITEFVAENMPHTELPTHSR